LELGAVASAAIPNAPPDQIIAQSPPANAVNVSEPKISLLMAAAPDTDSFVMPDLVGRSEDDAINVIVDAGMHVPTINTQAAQPTPPPATTPGSTPPAAPTGNGSRMVVKTTPAAGQRIFAGQPIAIEVTP
jgi:beta-lactam-binding protein with PASTA domain